MRICDIGDTSRMWGRGKKQYEFSAIDHLDHMPKTIRTQHMRCMLAPVKIWMAPDDAMQNLLDEYGVGIEYVCVMNPSNPIRFWALSLGEFLLPNDPLYQPINGVRRLPPVVRQYLTQAGAKIRTIEEEDSLMSI